MFQSIQLTMYSMIEKGLRSCEASMFCFVNAQEASNKGGPPFVYIMYGVYMNSKLYWSKVLLET